MIHRTHYGIPFLIHSPSLWEVRARDDGSDIAFVSFTFDGHDWYIYILTKSGGSHQRGPFASRDKAIELLAGRRQEQ